MTMKLRNIILSLLALTVLAVGCNKNEIAPTYDSFSVSKNFVNLPTDGSEVTIEVTSTESWSIFDRLFPDSDDWADFKVEPLKGDAGTTTVKISSSATTSSRQMDLCFVIGDRTEIDQLANAVDEIVAEYDAEIDTALTEGDEDAIDKAYDKKVNAAEQALNSAFVSARTQYVTVKQTAAALGEIKYTTIAKVLEENAVGKTFFVKGSVTKIVNTEYGNWTIVDETGSIYIYGTLDANGQDKNFASLGLEEGDMVEISGPYSVYNDTPQLKYVTILKHEKGAIKLLEKETLVEKDVKTVDIPISVLDGVEWSVTKFFYYDYDDDKKVVEVEVDWLTLGTQYPKDGNICQTINVADYLEDKAPRTAYVRFEAVKTVKETVLNEETGKEEEVVKKEPSTVEFKITQIGNRPEKEANIAAALAKAEDGTWVCVEGVVLAVSNSGVILTDEKEVNPIRLYCGYLTDFEVGDKIKVYGNINLNTKFYNMNNCYAELIPEAATVNAPKLITLTEEAIASIAAADENITFLFEYTGVMTGEDGNISVGEYTISPYSTLDYFYVDQAVDSGKPVTVQGYAYQLNNKTLSYVLTSLSWPKKVDDTPTNEEATEEDE